MKRIISVFCCFCFIVSSAYAFHFCGGGIGPRCQGPKTVMENGKIVYSTSYCQGEFPYCERWSGDCCSEPSYKLEDGSLCCDSSIYVSHAVSKNYHKGSWISDNVKCCSRALYGNKSTYYFDKDGHAQCCGGEVFVPRSDEDTEDTEEPEKQCCNHEFNDDTLFTKLGNVVRYYSVADIEDAPEDTDEKMCCAMYGEAPGKYKSTAYWDWETQMANCCAGDVYQNGFADEGQKNLECCLNTKGKDRTHVVLKDVLNAPEGEQGCCSVYKNGEGKKANSTAYWENETVNCCAGQVYEPYGTGTGKEKGYSCCTDEYFEGSTTCGNGVAEIVNPKEDGYKTTCCPYYKKEDGTCDKQAEAYMNGNSINCCKNVYTLSVQKDGTKGYACCEEETYIQKAKGSTRGVEACCSEGGVAFVDYPWSSSTHSVYWFEEDPEYGMINRNSNCCMHELADNAYGGHDCCAPTSEYSYATSSTIYKDTTPTAVKDYNFEICCPEGREAYYTGTVTMTNDDTGESKAYPKGACCKEGEVVIKYGKYNDVNNYTCCNVSEGSNQVRVAVQGAPEEGFEVCCEKYTSYSSGEGTIPEAYWNGSSGSCCNGTVYQSKEGVWECCDDVVSTNTPYGQNVCDVENAPVGGDTKDCCARYEGIDGTIKDAKSYSPSGSSISCCNGSAYDRGNGTYMCCPDGQKAVLTGKTITPSCGGTPSSYDEYYECKTVDEKGEVVCPDGTSWGLITSSEWHGTTNYSDSYAYDCRAEEPKCETSEDHYCECYSSSTGAIAVHSCDITICE